MTVTTPERTLDQRMASLHAANHIRSTRAKLKRSLKDRTGRPSSHIVRPTPETDTMKVYDLLMASPGLGRCKVGDLLTEHRISPAKTIGGMSARQRDELSTALITRWGL